MSDKQAFTYQDCRILRDSDTEGGNNGASTNARGSPTKLAGKLPLPISLSRTGHSEIRLCLLGRRHEKFKRTLGEGRKWFGVVLHLCQDHGERQALGKKVRWHAEAPKALTPTATKGRNLDASTK